MDWRDCLDKRVAKGIKEDKNMAFSLQEIAKIKIESAKTLPENLFIGKISLLYDALREYLESLALTNHYKIYNHECYTAFLNEFLGKAEESEKFDKLRKIRNSINYYGREMDMGEAEEVIKELNDLIKEIKTLL